MKRTLTAVLAMGIVSVSHGQQKEGKITYERVSQVQIRFNGMTEEMQRMIPKTRTEKFELLFGNNQSLWKQAEQDNDDENTFSSDGAGGLQVRMISAGSNDVLYSNFETSLKVEQRDIFDKKFIIDDSLRALKWKMTGETKTILSHNCMKATTVQITQQMQMRMTDGKMERKEVSDTSNIVAWFATDIPVSAGPAEYQGQLPGAILEMDIHDGRQVYRATEVATKVALADIKAPTGKKHYTPQEFREEREKMMAEMQKNNNGGVRIIRGN